MYKWSVVYSDLYGGFIGKCPALFRGVVSEDQDEFAATIELKKAILFKIDSAEESGEKLPSADNVEYKQKMSTIDLCPTCGQRTISFIKNIDYTKLVNGQ